VPIPRGKFFSLLLISLVTVITATGCLRSTPERTVREYLQLLSGERALTNSTLERLTTEHYRTTDHPHLAMIAEEQRESLGAAFELHEDNAIGAFLEKVTWETTYNVVRMEDNEAEMIARVIMIERNPGDLDEAREIEGLPPELLEILDRGLELPFRFTLKRVDDEWKVDEMHFPDELIPLLDIPDAVTMPENPD